MPPPSPPLCTLIIDDDEMSRELLTVLLEARGHAVDSAQSGEAALDYLSNKPTRQYQIILSDLQMPGVAGAELAKRLRQLCGPHPLLLAISGSQPPAEDIAPYDGFLLKPFRVETIEAALLNRATRAASVTDALGQSAPDRARRSPIGREKRTPASHQSRIASASPNGLSIAASAAQKASNEGMEVPIQQHESRSEKSQVNDGITLSPVLNEQIYRQLVQSMPPHQLQEMYTLCVNDARKRIASMRQMINDNDGAQFVREAHAIKGGSGMLGATELHRMAAALEFHGLSSRPNGSAQDVNSLDELCAACDRLERMLRSRV